MKKFLIALALLFLMFCLFSLAMMVLYISLDRAVNTAENEGKASELDVVLESFPCDPQYLVEWNIEGFGIMELKCEEGRYYGEIGEFSVSMTENKSRPASGVSFQAIFCKPECYAMVVRIDGNDLYSIDGGVEGIRNVTP